MTDSLCRKRKLADSLCGVKIQCTIIVSLFYYDVTMAFISNVTVELFLDAFSTAGEISGAFKFAFSEKCVIE